MQKRLPHALAFCALILACPLAAQAKAPNILVILADDIGWGDAGCYGAIKISTACAAAGMAPPPGALSDSVNLLPPRHDEADVPKRDFLVLRSGNGRFAASERQRKYIPDLDHADGWKAKRKDADAPARPSLFDLSAAPGETHNLAAEKNDERERLAARLAAVLKVPRTTP